MAIAAALLVIAALVIPALVIPAKAGTHAAVVPAFAGMTIGTALFAAHDPTSRGRPL